MRFPTLLEASKYSNELPPKMSSIYSDGSPLYSSLKTTLHCKDFSVPSADYRRSGILHSLNIIWYFNNNILHLYNYETGVLDTIPNFSSDVLYILPFSPIPGIFHSRVKTCLLVVTEADAIIYAFDGQSIVNTEFSAKLRSAPRCVASNSGRLYIGAEDGRVYQVIYYNIKILGYRFLRLYSSSGMFQGICNFFKRKSNPVIDISASFTRLVALSSNIITVYNIESGIYKIQELECESEYVKVQIQEDSPLFFYCVTRFGSRDFYTENGRCIHKDIPFHEGSEVVMLGSRNTPVPLLSTSPSQFLIALPNVDFSKIGFVSFNNFQLKNFSKMRPVENYEVVPFYSTLRAVSLSPSELLLLSDSKISIYNVVDAKRFLVSCRVQDVHEMYRSYGDIEFMVCYYDLISLGEDATRMDGICKNDNIKNYALFIFIYKLVKPIFNIDLGAVDQAPDSIGNDIPGALTEISDVSVGRQDPSTKFDSIVSRLKVLKNYVPLHFVEALSLIDEIIQTRYYISLLRSYSIKVSYTLEDIIMKENDFREKTLNGLLAAVSLSQSIDPLLKAMKNRCPLFLPYDEINMQRGLDLLRREEGLYLEQSLSYFLRAKFNESVVQRYNELGYYYGSVSLIREKFDFSYEKAVALLKSSVKCKRAVETGLQDTRESFLYPFFEVVISLEKYNPCCCCVNPEKEVDLIHINNPLFETFLKDMSTRSVDGANPREYNLYWKYLLAKGKKTEAAEAILVLCGRPEISFFEKLNLLKQALTVASCGGQQSKELRQRIKQMIGLAEIQRELVTRDPRASTAQLLTADELFNDYCYNHPDLGIRLLDVLGHFDTRVLRGLFSKFLETHSLQETLSFISTLSNKNLPVIIDLLADMPDADDNLGFALRDVGFGHSEILKAMGTTAGNMKSREFLRRCMEKFAELNRANS